MFGSKLIIKFLLRLNSKSALPLLFWFVPLNLEVLSVKNLLSGRIFSLKEA